jgi:hypothetical protein
MNFDTIHSTPQQEKGEKSEMERKLTPYVNDIKRMVDEVLHGGKYEVMPDIVIQEIQDQLFILSDEEVEWIAEKLQWDVDNLPGSQEHQEAHQKALNHLLTSRAFDRKVNTGANKEYVSEKEVTIDDVAGRIATLLKGARGEKIRFAPFLDEIGNLFSGASPVLAQGEARGETGEFLSTLRGLAAKVREKMGGQYTSEISQLEDAVAEYIKDFKRISS